MRPLILAAPAALLLTLAACAPTTNGSGYNSELRELTDSCAARGGILAPTGQQSGRPQNDNVCEIRSETGRIRRN